MQERGVKEKSQYNKTIKQNTENKKEQQKSQVPLPKLEEALTIHII